MYVNPISTRLLGGRSTPAIRATSPLLLTLSLLVLRVLADHPHDALPPDDLALVADLLHRRPDFHDPAVSSYPALTCTGRRSARGSDRKGTAPRARGLPAGCG